MWLVTLFVSLSQFVIIGAVLAAVLFAVADWFYREDDGAVDP